ncbi:MAG: alpha/beta hydrolase, partial [Candidatus Latescibacteria bacterium]|nr:alpha/beta hydrolase [Candidatus Latescibacterota bacterium]
AGRVIRSAGLNTTIPADGAVASGGTDVFLAGIFREVEPGGMVGVHTWQTTDGEGNVIVGSELPTADPRHLIFRNYYREMAIPEVFYWFSIQAAPADDIHWMTRQELSDFGVLRPESR